MHLYEIPVIQPDLRHEEAIVQSLHSLDYLNDVINDVFDKMEARVAKNFARISDLSQRVKIASSKIDSLKDTKKAILFNCPSKYPGQVEDFESTFKETSVVLKRAKPGDIKSSLDAVRNQKPQDKLQFYHVKVTDPVVPRVKPPTGIPLPLELITSVDSLLVFKKDEKPEKSKTPSTSSAPFEGGRKLDAAPTSIGNKNLGRPMVDEIFYSPLNDEAPELELPMDIPDLPGVAGDISFSLNDDFLAVPEKKPVKVVKIEVPEIAPPTPQEEIPSPIPVIAEAPPKAPEFHAPTLPPPPPPPMMPVEVVSQKKAPPPADQSDARSNLMAAIRSAGGKAKLRAAADRAPPPAAASKKKEKTPPAGDLMSDLRNRLSMRRKGISGAKEQNQEGGIMSKVSMMIPPPPLEATGTKEPEDEEDWN